MSLRSKATLFSFINLIAGLAVYRYLIAGGWLTNHYQWNDPNIVNLVLAVFEPIAIVSVIAYWVWRKSSLYRLISILAVIQIAIGAGFFSFHSAVHADLASENDIAKIRLEPPVPLSLYEIAPLNTSTSQLLNIFLLVTRHFFLLLNSIRVLDV